VSDKLNGIVIVFTGVRDKGLEEKITMNGGLIGGSVSDKTTYLVAKDPSSNSSKLTKAREIGVKVIGLNEAQNLWG
jgi:DNA ligase (NAD+)